MATTNHRQPTLFELYVVLFGRPTAEYNSIAVIREYTPRQHPITPDNITRIHKRNSLFQHRASTFLLFPPGGLSVVLLQLALASTLLLTLSLLCNILSFGPCQQFFFEMGVGLHILIALALASSGLSLPLTNPHAEKFVVAKYVFRRRKALIYLTTPAISSG